MGKDSRIRQERKAGLVEKPVKYHKDRFPIVMRVIAIVLIVVIATWGSFFAVKSTTGTIAYQVGTGKVLQSDITTRVQNYIDMYTQYGMDLTTAANASTLKSVRQNVIDSSIEQELFIQYATSKNMKIDQAKLKTALDTEVENAVTQSQQQFGTDTQGFNDAVIAKYGSMDKFKATIRTQIQPYVERQQLADAVTAEIDAGVTVSDADVKTYFASQGRVNAEHLLINIDTDNDSSSTIAAKKKVAQAVYDEVVKQKAENATFDFATYAKEKAAELNKKTAGYATYETLGFFTAGQMVKGFETAAFAAKTGDIVGPIQTEFGFHIIHKIGQEPVSTIYDTAETVESRTHRPRLRNRRPDDRSNGCRNPCKQGVCRAPEGLVVQDSDHEIFHGCRRQDRRNPGLFLERGRCDPLRCRQESENRPVLKTLRRWFFV